MIETNPCKSRRDKKILHNQPHGTSRYRWEDNIERDIHELGFSVMGWVDLAQDRERLRAFVIAVKKSRVL